MNYESPAQISPAATLSWGWDWTDWLPSGDTIASHALQLSDGLATNGASSVDGAVVSVLLEVQPGVRIDQSMFAACTITTAAGLVDTRTIYLRVAVR